MVRIGFSEFQRNLAAHFDRVESNRVELVVTRQDHEDLVILPLAELESLRETMHLLSSPINALRLREGIAELEAGKGVEHDLIEL